MNNLKSCSNAGGPVVRPGILLPGKLKLLLSALLLSLALFESCGPSVEEKAFMEESQRIQDSVAHYIPSLTTDTINGVTHNFIKKALIHCRVKNVRSASHEIENLVWSCGGYVSNSELSTSISFSNSIKFKEDSVLESSHYTLSNFIMLRVPNRQLDTVLRKIASIADFIDMQRLSSDDVKMKIYANQLAENRLHTYEQKLSKKAAISALKTKQALSMEETFLENQAMADQKRIESYDLADQVNYSTVTVELQQPQQVYTQVLAIPKQPAAYTPPFFTKLKSSFLNGFQILESIVLFLIEIWVLILLGSVLLIVLKRKKPLFFQRSMNTK